MSTGVSFGYEFILLPLEQAPYTISVSTGVSFGNECSRNFPFSAIYRKTTERDFQGRKKAHCQTCLMTFGRIRTPLVVCVCVCSL
ncbi:hypothetical protein TNCV_921491 [Trichonephila clavipes]|nr:hypothetical protein TNCV_921491 [Trichonephila clavipes]